MNRDLKAYKAFGETNDLLFNLVVGKNPTLKEDSKIFIKAELESLRKTYERIASGWSGEESGVKEEKALAAREGIEHIKDLLQVMDELN